MDLAQLSEHGVFQNYRDKKSPFKILKKLCLLIYFETYLTGETFLNIVCVFVKTVIFCVLYFTYSIHI